MKTNHCGQVRTKRLLVWWKIICLDLVETKADTFNYALFSVVET